MRAIMYVQKHAKSYNFVAKLCLYLLSGGKKMKKTYQNPELEIHMLSVQDFITTSGEDNWLEWDTTEG